MKVVNGAIIQVHTIEMQKRTEEDKESLLLTAITEIRQRMMSTSREIIVPFELDFNIDQVTMTIPLKGDKKKLLELSARNAFYYKQEKLKQLMNRSPQKRTDRIMETIEK